MSKEAKTVFNEIIHKNVRSAVYFDCGYNNANFLINDSYVLRLTKPFGDPTINYRTEKEVYNLINSINISEKIVYLNEEDGTKITRFVHGTRKYINTPTNEQIIFVAKKLKKLHNSGLKVSLNYSMFDKLITYKNNVNKSDFLDKKYEEKILKETKKIFDKNPLVLCHNDLVKDNLLFKFNDVVFIDWEYASMNNPLFDLASFISENNLSDKQSELFLSKYFGAKYNSLKKKRIELFEQFQDILFYYWALYLFNNRKEEIYKSISEIKLKRIKEHQ